MSDKYIIEYNNLTDEEVLDLIAECEVELKNRRKARLSDVQESIRKLADSVGMSPEDLISNMKKEKAVKPKVIRFINTENQNETWSGRGKRPRWINDALDKGISIEKFRVSN